MENPTKEQVKEILINNSWDDEFTGFAIECVKRDIHPSSCIELIREMICTQEDYMKFYTNSSEVIQMCFQCASKDSIILGLHIQIKQLVQRNDKLEKLFVATDRFHSNYGVGTATYQMRLRHDVEFALFDLKGKNNVS